jgi:hypothetical protein
VSQRGPWRSHLARFFSNFPGVHSLNAVGRRPPLEEQAAGCGRRLDSPPAAPSSPTASAMGAVSTVAVCRRQKRLRRFQRQRQRWCLGRTSSFKKPGNGTFLADLVVNAVAELVTLAEITTDSPMRWRRSHRKRNRQRQATGDGERQWARGFGPALTPSVMASSPPLQPGEFFFSFWVRQAAGLGFQADALEAPVAAVKIWRPTAVRTFFVDREE